MAKAFEAVIAWHHNFWPKFKGQFGQCQEVPNQIQHINNIT
jgi:hypothetical protein